MSPFIRAFLIPRLTKGYALRVLVVAIVAILVCRYLCQPVWIRGSSMEPSYHDGAFTFIFRPRYWFHPPSPGDVVAVRLAGPGVMYLKRVIAAPGDTVAFSGGNLFVNGERRPEPYVVFPCDWDLPPRTVKPGFVYVVGDNRDVEIDRHIFGQTPLNRIIGRPLW